MSPSSLQSLASWFRHQLEKIILNFKRGKLEWKKNTWVDELIGYSIVESERTQGLSSSHMGQKNWGFSPSSDTKVFDLAPVVFSFGRMFVLLCDWHCAEIFYYHKDATKKMIIQKRIENWANFSKSSTLAL